MKNLQNSIKFRIFDTQRNATQRNATQRDNYICKNRAFTPLIHINPLRRE
jgi:hypothetical protein